MSTRQEIDWPIERKKRIRRIWFAIMVVLIVAFIAGMLGYFLFGR